MNQDIPLPTPEQWELIERAQRALNAKQANARKAKAKAQRQRDTGGNRRRWQTFNAFCGLDKKAAGLRPGDVALWCILFRHADRRGVVCLAQSRMQEYTGLSRSGTRRALQRLVETGHLVRLKQGGPNAGLAVYKVGSQWRKVGSQ